MAFYSFYDAKQFYCHVSFTMLPTWNVFECSIQNLPVVLTSDSLDDEFNRLFYIVSEWVSGCTEHSLFHHYSVGR